MSIYLTVIINSSQHTSILGSKYSMSLSRKLRFIGWILFTISAVFYGIDNIRNGQYISLLGSIAFFIGCLVFMTALSREKDRE